MTKLKDKKDLWLALRGYHFNHMVPESNWDKVTETFGGENAATKAFAEKIAKKLNWRKDFALLAIHEYKKFVFLAIVSDFSVTPSEIIDKVWHEHMLFTRAYRKFCDEVINFKLDHEPELLNFTEQTGTFSAQYLATLDLYKKEFNADPPEAVWSKPKFDQNEVSGNYTPKKKKKKSESSVDSGYFTDDSYLHTHFPSDTGTIIETNPGQFGGGESNGGGTGGTWSDPEINNPGDNTYSHSTESIDSTDSGSFCSSSCGGD